MGTAKWLVVLALGLAASGAQAQEKTQAYIAPFAGYTHMRIDGGTVFTEPDTMKFDAVTFGATFGFRMPVGFLVEVGRSHAIHADLFYNDSDIELLHTSGAVGWRFAFADGWHFTPKVGRLSWELASDHKILLDDDGDRHKTIQGWDNFYELDLTHELKKNISMGVMFKDVDEEFGHSRSGAFTVSFAF